LYQNRVAYSHAHASSESFCVGNEKVVSDKLYLAAQFTGEHGPAIPVVLGESVFDGNDGILGAPFHIKLDEIFGGIHRLVRLLEDVLALLVEEFAGRDIE